MRPFLLLFAGLLIAAAPTETPADFTTRLPVQLAPGAPFQRIELPPKALAALQSDSLADLRVFDSQGQSLPIARAGPLPQQDVTRDIPLKPLPIMGTPGALNVTGVSLKLENGQSRVVRLDGDLQPGAIKTLGVLFDTRKLTDPARALRLDADLPPRQPVTLRVESSPDLRIWQPAGQAVIYNDPENPAETTIDLAGQSLKDHYLRLTWATDTPPIAPITINAATLRTGQPGPAATGPQIEIAARRDSAHRLSLALPFATPVTALAIEPAGDNVVVPVRIMGRHDREQPWQLLGAGTAYRLTRNGKTDFGPPIPLSGSAAQIQIEGDDRTPGFATTPRIKLGFAPASVIVLAQGAPPHEIAVGNPRAATALLPIAALVPNYRAGDEYALPVAAVAVDQGAEIAAAPPEPRFGGQKLLLWAVLIGATLLLAALVWALRRNQS